MKIYAKPSISYILVLSLVLCFFSVVPVHAAETQNISADGFRYTLDANGDATITGYTQEVASLTIPDMVGGHKVTGIGKCAFEGYQSLTGVVIASGVTSIGELAFNACKALESIEIPDSVTSMGRAVFYQCNALKSVKLPTGITRIENNMFSECTNLTTVNIPSSVTSIGAMAFCDCRSLTKLDIPASVTSIESWAFGGCTDLTELVIPPSVTAVGKELFLRTGSLLTVCYPLGLFTDGDIPGTGVSYVLNGDGTASAIAEKVPEGVTKVAVPGSIMGNEITSVKGSQGVDISKVTVELDIPFTITDQPFDISISYGNAKQAGMTAGVTVTAGTTEPVTYQ